MIARICVVLMFAFSLVPCCIAQLPAGLVAGFGFDEGTGTTASDSSGNGNIAALRNGVTWTAGHFGNGLAFDGTSGYLSMPNSPSLDISGNGLTLSLWINPQPLNGGDSVVFGKFWNTTMTSPFYQYGLELNGGNRPFFFIGTNSGFLYADMGSTLAYGQWTHLAITFDGSQASFYRNGTLINSVPLAATIQARGNSINVGADITPAQFFKGSLDELKIYGRPLSPAEILTDMNGSAGSPDLDPPSIPTGLGATVISQSQIDLAWNASTDNIAVVSYDIFRDNNQIATSILPSYADTGLAPSTSYSYTVRAADGAGNVSDFSATVVATTLAPDTTPPTISMNSPAPDSTVSGLVFVSATASDDTGVAGVQFLLDGVNLDAEDTTPPYGITWNTSASANGVHALSARARDAAGNTTSASIINVTVLNIQTAGLAAGWNFNEGAGSIAYDVTGNNTITNVTGWTAGEYGSGVSFTGGSFLSVPDSPSLDISGTALTLSMWISPQPLSSGDDVILSKLWGTTQISPYYQYGLELDAGSTPHFYVGTPGGLVGASMGSSLPFDQWNHLAVVFDGSQVQFYLNAALVSTQPLAAGITGRGNPLNIGADANGAQRFIGSLDDVRIYGRSLTQPEIQTDMNTPLGGTSGSDTILPTVSISAPLDNAQVSDIIVVTADADDNVAVAGVSFFVDDSLVGAEDPDPPYGVSWDTRSIPNGAHTLKARARDTSGNVAFSSTITVNVTNSNYFQNEILATGFELPTSIKFLPDGRMLVVELQGTIKILPPPYTQPDPSPFLQLTNVGSAGVQQGVYDIALDPDFVNNHYYYIFYTAGSPNHDRLSRFTADASLTGTVAGSEVVLYEDPQNANAEHHGGSINFGNDGKLYFTTGEHFDANAAQLLSSPRGKIHRINKDGTVPTDNPFYDGNGPNWDSIWALGLRNPYRAYYDAPTGRLIIGDVGGNDYTVAKEEVNVGARAANYGWPNYEGLCSGSCTSPVFYYPHNGRDACITGGFVYHGTQFPSGYQGSYFFADYTQNWIRRLTFDANGNVDGVFSFEPADGSVDGPYGDIVYLTEGPDGALYYVDLGYSDIGGTFGISKIRRIRYIQTNQAPVAVANADITKGPSPLNVAFSSAGSTDPEGQALTYEWTFGDNSSSTEANPIHTYVQSGQYTARLSVSDGVNTTLAPPIFINVGNPPNITFLSPQDGSFFRAGDVISFSADATDPEDGVLPSSAFTWDIDFLHEGHVHPGIPITDTKSGTFTIPISGHDFSGYTRYRITLTVTDSDGLQSSQAVLVYPEKVDLTFDTLPQGLTLYLDGIANVTPFVHDTLIGFNHTIDARNQSLDLTGYSFESWSDGGAQQHTIIVPDSPQSYLASYIAQNPLPAGLVAGFGFDEGTGTTASDSSGNGNIAALRNGVTWTAGHFGNGLAFDGTSGYLSMPNSPSLDISGNGLTLSLWINPQPLNGGDSVVFGKFWNTTMTSPFYQYGLELNGGNRPYFFIGTNSGFLYADMGSTLAYGQWTHLAITLDGSQASFYRNGTLINSVPLAATIQARGNSINVGADITPAQFFKGSMDELKIYGRSLSPAEVLTDMNTALP